MPGLIATVTAFSTALMMKSMLQAPNHVLSTHQHRLQRPHPHLLPHQQGHLARPDPSILMATATVQVMLGRTRIIAAYVIREIPAVMKAASGLSGSASVAIRSARALASIVLSSSIRVRIRLARLGIRTSVAVLDQRQS